MEYISKPSQKGPNILTFLEPETADSGEMRTQFLKYNILEHIIKLEALDEFADIEFLSIQAWLIGRGFHTNFIH